MVQGRPFNGDFQFLRRNKICKGVHQGKKKGDCLMDPLRGKRAQNLSKRSRDFQQGGKQGKKDY